jgi:hypothetical protein
MSIQRGYQGLFGLIVIPSHINLVVKVESLEVLSQLFDIVYSLLLQVVPFFIEVVYFGGIVGSDGSAVGCGALRDIESGRQGGIPHMHLRGCIIIIPLDS